MKNTKKNLFTIRVCAAETYKRMVLRVANVLDPLLKVNYTNRKRQDMNITEKEFIQLAREHLIVLEDIKMNKKGYYDMNIYGIEKLYKAIKEHKLKLKI